MFGSAPLSALSAAPRETTFAWIRLRHGDEDVATPFPLGAMSGCTQLDVDPPQASIGDMPGPTP